MGFSRGSGGAKGKMVPSGRLGIPKGEGVFGRVPKHCQGIAKGFVRGCEGVAQGLPRGGQG
eukprot:8159059-Alexandrium_andersonii.AAC.1